MDQCRRGEGRGKGRGEGRGDGRGDGRRNEGRKAVDVELKGLEDGMVALTITPIKPRERPPPREPRDPRERRPRNALKVRRHIRLQTASNLKIRISVQGVWAAKICVCEFLLRQCGLVNGPTCPTKKLTSLPIPTWTWSPFHLVKLRSKLNGHAAIDNKIDRLN